MTAPVATATARSGAAGTAPFGDPAAADAAQRSVRADSSIQFDFPDFIPPRTEPPRWLADLFGALARFVEWVGGGWTVLMWIALALTALALLFALFPPARAWLRERLARTPRATPAPLWMPQAAVARALLDEADQLAAAGSYDAAVRLLLHRSVEDIERWRGDRLRPSLTSRDIARIDSLPDAARAVFGRIVADVERSFFAGQPLSADDWQRARADYAGFARAR